MTDEQQVSAIRTSVWSYFKLKEEGSKTAKCNLCRSVLRGIGNFKTTNLIKHLQ